jgi:hypothetical protein
MGRHALAAQLLGQLGKAIRDRRIEVLVQIDQIGDHHHHRMAMAQILDPSARADDVEDVLGLFIKAVEEGLVNDGEMIGVGGVLQLDLPVAGEAEPVLAQHLHAEPRALLHEQVHPLLRRAQELDQRLDVVLEGGKDHALIDFGAQRISPNSSRSSPCG